MPTSVLDLYYLLKPFIPRRLQIAARQLLAARKRRFVGHVWPIDPKAAAAPRGWRGWPDGKKFALVLNHDVDTQRGHDRCGSLMELEKRLGFRSSFYFVPEGYRVSAAQRRSIEQAGFEVGVHGLRHDGKMFKSRRIFEERARRINEILKEWRVVGFSSPSMHRNLDWVLDLDIEYDISTFDTDPFEPQNEGVGRIFPFFVNDAASGRGYVEIPYTLPQDHNLFIILGEKDIRVWAKKLEWITANGGMALVNTHPDYMLFDGARRGFEEYPVRQYLSFLEHVRTRYAGQYWNALAREVARFWRAEMAPSGAGPAGTPGDEAGPQGSGRA